MIISTKWLITYGKKLIDCTRPSHIEGEVKYADVSLFKLLQHLMILRYNLYYFVIAQFIFYGRCIICEKLSQL